MTTATKERTSSGALPLIGFAVLVVIGIVAWFIQLTQGMSTIGISQAVVWGLYIAVFFTLAGLASGLVILAALGDFDVIPGLKEDKRGLLIGAIACYVAAGFMILMDIGHPLRVLNFILSTNFTSPFVWDFFSLALAVILTAIYLFWPPKGRWFAVLTAIVAGLVVVIEGWILSMSAGSPLWHGGVMPAVFLVEALSLALAVVLITRFGQGGTAWMRRALLVLLPILFLLNLFEIPAVLYAGEPEAQAALAIYLTNPLFWIQLVLGVIVPFIMLLIWKDHAFTVTAACLVALGVLLSKSLILIAGQSLPFMMAQAVYQPTLVELGGVLGILGLAGLLFVLGQRFLTPKAAKA